MWLICIFIFLILTSHNVHFHGYADDTQLYVTFKPDGVASKLRTKKQRKKQETEKSALCKLERCIEAIRNWMAINWLKLNDDKTEFIVLGSNPNLSKIKTHSITVGEHQIRRSNQVRNIGAIFDANAKMEGQVTKTCQTAWFHLYTISKISQYLTKEQKQTIIHAYVTPRLDQNNSLLGGLPLTQMNKLQLVQNSAAKIILGGKKHDHVTDHLIKLHWLPISQRRIFKILLLVFKALNGQGPIYLAEMLVPCSNSEHDLRSSYDNLLVVQPRIVRHMVTALLVFWDLVCGTICQKRSGVVVVCHLSRVHLKHIFSNSRLGFNIISSKYFSRNSELCSVRMYIGWTVLNFRVNVCICVPLIILGYCFICVSFLDVLNL